MRFKLFFVQNSNVIEIPAKKLNNHILEHPKLSDQSGLLVSLFYKTLERKPHEIVHIEFDRITFDNKGVYRYSEQTLAEQFHIKLKYAMSDLMVESTLLPLPIAPDIPNKEELHSIKVFLNNKYSVLLERTPFAFETVISNLKEIHEKHIYLMKKSHKNQ
ncbi:hypothetical protein [Viridibacillus arvi]|uniref:hypothetical protein n=1 Tax=Viridibacillus arvi TaxID=263475 RepID=UPI0034CE666D